MKNNRSKRFGITSIEGLVFNKTKKINKSSGGGEEDYVNKIDSEEENLQNNSEIGPDLLGVEKWL